MATGHAGEGVPPPAPLGLPHLRRQLATPRAGPAHPCCVLHAVENFGPALPGL